MTIEQYLVSGSGVIKKLLSFILNKDLAWLYAHCDYKLSARENKTLNQYINKIKSGYPLAYILGEQGFYHLNFVVNEDTLIPRPETENIIDIIKKINLSNAKVLDLGTGSGAIAITIKDLFPHYQVVATDIDNKALNVAKINASNNNTDISFILSDWFANINEMFDIIIANPPYIAANSSYLKFLQFEPKLTLVADDNGMSAIKNIINNAVHYLRKPGYLLLEHGFDQRDAVVKLLNKFNTIELFDDINNINRNVLARI